MNILCKKVQTQKVNELLSQVYVNYSSYERIAYSGCVSHVIKLPNAYHKYIGKRKIFT